MVSKTRFSAAVLAALVAVASFVAPLRARASCSDAYCTAVMGLSPLAYYRLDETSGTTAADASGNNHNGTWTGSNPIRGAASLIPGAGGDYSFGATTQSVSPVVQSYVALPSSGWPTISAWTIVAWTTLGKGTAGPIVKWGCVGATWIRGGVGGTQYAFSYANPTTCGSWQQSGLVASAAPGSNVMVTVTCCTSTEGLWVNTSHAITTAGPSPSPNTKPSTIGSGGGSTANGAGFNSYYCQNVAPSYCGIDDVALFNYALTASQISDLYAVGILSPAGAPASFLGAW